MEHFIFDFQPLITTILTFIIIKVLNVASIHIIISVYILLLFLYLLLFFLGPDRLLPLYEKGVLAPEFNLK